MKTITYPDGVLKVLDVATPTNSTEQTANGFRCDANSGVDEGTLSSSNISILTLGKTFYADTELINHTTVDAGTEYKVDITSDPTLYMEGMGMILDTTPPAPATAFRTSLTSTQLQSNADPFNINIQNLSLNGIESTEGQVITADANGKPVWQSIPTPYISSFGVASGGITSLPSINASGEMTIGGDLATTGLTIGRIGYTTSMGGNLSMGGNDISGVYAINGNNNALSIGSGAGTTTSVTIGRTGISVDLVNTVRLGASTGTVSAGTAGDVVTSQGAGQPTIYKAITLSTIVGGYLAPNSGQSQYQRIRVTTITPPIVGAKYMFSFNGGFTNNNVLNVEQRLVLCSTAGTVASPTIAQSINLINSLSIFTTPPDELTSLAICRWPTLFMGNQNFIYIYTSTGITAITFSVWAYNPTSNTLGLKNHNFDVIRIA
jgi:hypothetical protein